MTDSEADEILDAMLQEEALSYNRWGLSQCTQQLANQCTTQTEVDAVDPSEMNQIIVSPSAESQFQHQLLADTRLHNTHAKHVRSQAHAAYTQVRSQLGQPEQSPEYPNLPMLFHPSFGLCLPRWFNHAGLQWYLHDRSGSQPPCYDIVPPGDGISVENSMANGALPSSQPMPEPQSFPCPQQVIIPTTSQSSTLQYANTEHWMLNENALGDPIQPPPVTMIPLPNPYHATTPTTLFPAPQSPIWGPLPDPIPLPYNPLSDFLVQTTMASYPTPQNPIQQMTPNAFPTSCNTPMHHNDIDGLPILAPPTPTFIKSEESMVQQDRDWLVNEFQHIAGDFKEVNKQETRQENPQHGFPSSSASSPTINSEEIRQLAAEAGVSLHFDEEVIVEPIGGGPYFLHTSENKAPQLLQQISHINTRAVCGPQSQQPGTPSRIPNSISISQARSRSPSLGSWQQNL